jgi:hypothetical protein
MTRHHIARHNIDSEAAHVKYVELLERLDESTIRAYESCRCSDLDIVRQCATLAGSCGVAVAPDDPRPLAALATAAAAGSASWSIARADGHALPVRIAGRLLAIGDRADPAQFSPRRWLDDYWLALLSDDPHASSALCYVPARMRNAERSEPHLDHLAEAMRRYWLHDDTAPEALLEALRASDPKQVASDSVDLVLDIDVPLIEVVFALFEADGAKLDRALAKAFELHRRYWGEQRSEDKRGWLASALAAISAHAARIGVAVITSSDYAQPLLLQATYANRQLLLCPYCMGPLWKGSHLCPACLEDTTQDAWIETDLGSFHASRRKRCRSCSMLVSRLAVRCPSCRAAPG